VICIYCGTDLRAERPLDVEYGTDVVSGGGPRARDRLYEDVCRMEREAGPPRRARSTDRYRRLLSNAVQIAKDLLLLDEIATNSYKKGEIEGGVLFNLRLAQAALDSGQDSEGRPITVREIGQGLGRMLTAMGGWFYLRLNSGAQVELGLDKLRSAVEEAAKEMQKAANV